MCRAVWVLIVGASDEACKMLRRAAGAEAQVVGMTSNPSDAPALAETTNADVAVIDATTPDAASIVEEARERAPQAAIVWVGDDAPEDSDARVPAGADLADALPGAITKALIERRRRP